MSNGLTLPFEGSTTAPGDAFNIASTQGNAVVGTANAQGTSGVLGTADGPYGAGVTGTSSSSHGVHGMNGNGANNPPVIAAGLWGETDGGYGVYGASITNNGVHGDSTQSDAVVGIAHAQGKSGVLGSSDNGNGVSGISASGNGVFGSGGQFAGFFDGNVNVTGTLEIGGPIKLGNNSQVAFVYTVQQADLYPNDPSDYGFSPFCAVLNHPLTTNNPSALLYVTPIGFQNTQDWGNIPGLTGTLMAQPTPVMVMYGAYPQGTPTNFIPSPITNSWVLVGATTVGQSFNVLVLNP